MAAGVMATLERTISAAEDARRYADRCREEGITWWLRDAISMVERVKCLGCTRRAERDAYRLVDEAMQLLYGYGPWPASGTWYYEEKYDDE